MVKRKAIIAGKGWQSCLCNRLETSLLLFLKSFLISEHHHSIDYLYNLLFHFFFGSSYFDCIASKTVFHRQSGWSELDCAFLRNNLSAFLELKSASIETFKFHLLRHDWKLLMLLGVSALSHLNIYCLEHSLCKCLILCHFVVLIDFCVRRVVLLKK